MYRIGAISLVHEADNGFGSSRDHYGWTGEHAIVTNQTSSSEVWVYLLFEWLDFEFKIVDILSSYRVFDYP
jgi:hypothetical protein